MVNKGEPATAPADPTRTGYSFIGWDADYSAVESNLTVTAKYAPISYTVAFDANGGTGTMAVEPMAYGTAAALTVWLPRAVVGGRGPQEIPPVG